MPVAVKLWHWAKHERETGSPKVPFEQFETQLLVTLSPNVTLGEVGQSKAATQV